MKVVVDLMRCDGNGACVLAAPKVFDLDDHDDLIILQEEPSEEARDSVEAAVAACPKRALLIVET
jgi:ferredoxin